MDTERPCQVSTENVVVANSGAYRLTPNALYVCRREFKTLRGDVCFRWDQSKIQLRAGKKRSGTLTISLPERVEVGDGVFWDNDENELMQNLRKADYYTPGGHCFLAELTGPNSEKVLETPLGAWLENDPDITPIQDHDPEEGGLWTWCIGSAEWRFSAIDEH